MQAPSYEPEYIYFLGKKCSISYLLCCRLELNQVGEVLAQSNCYALSYWWMILSCLNHLDKPVQIWCREKKSKKFSWEKGRDEQEQSLDKEHQENANCNRHFRGYKRDQAFLIHCKILLFFCGVLVGGRLMMQGEGSSFYWKYRIAILPSVSCSGKPNRPPLVHGFCEVVSFLNSYSVPAFNIPFHLSGKWEALSTDRYWFASIFSLEET